MRTRNAKGENPRLRRTLRLLRFCTFCMGMISIMWFFFSFVGLVIGLLFFIFMKDPAWKRNGFVLSFSIALTTLVAHLGTGRSPLFLAMASGMPMLGGSLIFFMFWDGLKARGKNLGRMTDVLAAWSRKVPRRAALLLTLASVAGISGMWLSVSVDFRVMFDNAPRMLWVHVPSTAGTGEPFTVTVQAWDGFERLSATYTGTVSFEIESYNETSLAPITTPVAALPDTYTFTGQIFGSDAAQTIDDGNDNGMHAFIASIDTPGIHYVKVHDSLTANVYWSNPVRVANASSLERLFWGDPHTHSALSDGSGTADEVFSYARRVACLDFHALTDHAELLAFVPFGLDTVEQAANKWYEPGTFVTFPGIEWTCVEEGHQTLVFSGNRILRTPISSYFDVKTTGDLWEVLDAFTAETGDDALAFPHHTTKKAYMQDWTYTNPKYVRVAEVSSTHGDFLFEQRHPLNYRGAQDPPATYQHGSSIMDALEMGYRLTLSAGSDSHDGHPGHTIAHTGAYHGHQRPYTTWLTRLDKPYCGSLTCVRATALTRPAIFEGIYQGRVFASSDFGRPIVEFSINGTRTGYNATLLAAGATDTRNITVFIAQDGAPAPAYKTSAASRVTANGWQPGWSATVEIFKNGLLLQSLPITSPVGRVEVLDSTPITGADYGSAKCTARDGQYFINDFSDNPVDPSILNTGGADFYLVRVVFSGGRMAWAGPVWVEAA